MLSVTENVPSYYLSIDTKRVKMFKSENKKKVSGYIYEEKKTCQK